MLSTPYLTSVFDGRKYINENMQGGNSATNILGTPLVPCCPTGKVTGFYRDGIGNLTHLLVGSLFCSIPITYMCWLTLV